MSRTADMDELLPLCEESGLNPAAAAAILADTIAPAQPKPELRDRLTARIAAYEELKPLAELRTHEGAWSSAGAPGVEMRRLFRDPDSGRTTLLLRMEPGARLPAHRHGDHEQCLVLSGDIGWGELIYREGDFVTMGKGTSHPEIRSEQGNLLLLVAGRNEFV